MYAMRTLARSQTPGPATTTSTGSQCSVTFGTFSGNFARMGDEPIPLGKVKDFSPYVSKMRAGARHRHWGPDLTLLIKADMEAGLRVKWFTVVANVGGAPTAIGPSAEGRVLTAQGFNENAANEQGDPTLEEWVARFRATHDFDFYAAQYRSPFQLGVEVGILGVAPIH
jgi:hypothetical protein